MSSATGWSLIGAVLLALLHIAAGRLHRGEGARTRTRWLSAASGISVAYVFIDLIPDLAVAQARWLEAWPDRLLAWFEGQVYLAALIGLLLALGLDRATDRRGEPRERFWLHTGSFAIYSMLVGGFALRLTGVVPMILAVLAFGAHFLVNDHTLSLQHGRAFERSARWLLASSVLIGWLIAALWRPPVVVVAALLGLLSGGIILDVIKEEVRGARERKFPAFVAGALVYAALLIALSYSLRAD